jgi:L-alanine-DL-glutamate epimerase-like enolase superfamily enzyme
MRDILDAGAVDVLMPDLQRVGGLSEMRRACALAMARDVPVSTHLFTEHSLCIAGAEPNCVSVEHMPWFAPLFNESMEIRDGMIDIPQRPGTGFSFDPEAVARYQLAQ